MTRLPKVLLGLLGLLVIVVLALVVAVTTLDPNEHKDWIANKFNDNTGRSLQLQGDLALTLYPWLGVEVNDVTVGNAPGFGDTPFLHADYANLRVKLLPLLQGQYEVDTVQLHGLALNLAVNEAGQDNWSDLAGPGPAEQVPPAPQGELPLAAVVLGGVDIRDASLSYNNAVTGARHSINNLAVTTGELTYGAPVDLDLSLEAASNQPEVAAELAMNGTIRYAPGGMAFEVRPLQLTGTLRSSQIPGGETELELETAVSLDLDADTAAIHDLQLVVLDTRLQGGIIASRVTSPAASVSGQLDVTGQDLSLLFRLLQVEPLASQLASLEDRSFTFNARLDADLRGGTVEVPELRAELLGASIQGGLSAQNIQSDTPAIQGQLVASGPDLPVLMQVAGQIQGGRDAPLAEYGRKLGAVSRRAFTVETRFDADLDSGNINVPTLMVDTLGVQLTGNLSAQDMQAAGGSVQGNLKLDSQRAGELLTALDQAELGQVLRSVEMNAAVSGNRSGLNLRPLALNLRFAGQQIPNSPVDVSLNAASRVNLEQERLNIDDFTLSGLGLDINGRLNASGILQAPEFDGRVSVAPFNLRQLLRQLNQDPPETASDQALRRLGLDAEFSGSANNLTVSRLAVQLDDSNLTGSLGVTDFSNPAVQADLAVDRINLDDYLPPGAEDQPTTPETAAGAAAQLPVDTLRAVNARLDFKAGDLTVSNLRLTEVVARLNGKDGRIVLEPLSAQLYQGSYSGRILLDATGETPGLEINSNLTGVQIEPLLTDLSDTPAQLHGNSNINLGLTAAGATTEAMKRNLNGKVDLKVEDGVLIGVDVRRVLEQAEIILESQRIGRIERGERTEFEQLTASFLVRSGVVTNDDLIIRSPGFEITGKGTVANLVEESINYDMLVDVVRESATRGEERYNIGGYRIPIRCRGNMTAPACQPDYGGLVTEAVRRIGTDKLKEFLNRSLGGGQQQGQSSQQAAPSGQGAQQQDQQDGKKQTQPEPGKTIEDALKKGLEGLFR